MSVARLEKPEAYSLVYVEDFWERQTEIEPARIATTTLSIRNLIKSVVSSTVMS